MNKITNNGKEKFPNAEDYLADYALLVEGGVLSIYDKTIEKRISANFLSYFDTLTEVEWLNFFLSPFTNFWLFENMHKDAIRDEEWNMLHEQYDSFEHVNTENKIIIFKKLPTVFLDDLRSFGIGSKRDDCLNADFLNPDSKLFRDSIENINKAFKLIELYTPGFYLDSLSFVNSIALVDQNASFRGASGAKRMGLIYFSPDKNWDEYKWAEEIIHETTHCLLDVVSGRTPLLNNTDAFEEKYIAPFRRDKRPLHGNFHALTVISRCLAFFKNVSDSNSDVKLAMNQRISDFLERGRLPFEQLKKDANFSLLGELLFQQIITPVFEPVVTI